MSEIPNPKFKTGDTAYGLWLNLDPVKIQWKGKKFATYFPKSIVSQKIMTDGVWCPQENTYAYKSLDAARQPTTIYEDGLYENRYQAEKAARQHIVNQVVATLELFFEIGAKAGYGSKAAWQEIMDASVIQLYDKVKPTND